MKLTDFLSGVGRYYSYSPNIARMLGSVQAAVFVSNILNHLGTQNHKEGWVYTTAKDTEKETGLSYREQQSVRKDLLGKGVLEEYYERLYHRMWFRLVKEKIDESWEAFSEKEKAEAKEESENSPEQPEPQFPNSAKHLTRKHKSAVRESTKNAVANVPNVCSSITSITAPISANITAPISAPRSNENRAIAQKEEKPTEPKKSSPSLFDLLEIEREKLRQRKAQGLPMCDDVPYSPPPMHEHDDPIVVRREPQESGPVHIKNIIPGIMAKIQADYERNKRGDNQ